MQKPSGYDEVQVGGDFTPAELGGHHMIIKGVKEQESKTGKPMIVVAFDFAKNNSIPVQHYLKYTPVNVDDIDK